MPDRMTAKLAAAMCVVAVATLAAPGRASAATRFYDTNGGAACHAANGGAANKFTFNNHYLTNIGTTDQYVICHFQMDDDAAVGPATIDYLAVWVQMPTSGSTVSCVAQTGHWYNNTLFAEATVGRSYTSVGANQNAYLEWEAVLPRASVSDALTLNCKLGPGMKLGLIARRESSA